LLESTPTRVPLLWLLLPFSAGIALSAIASGWYAYVALPACAISTALCCRFVNRSSLWSVLVCGAALSSGLAYATLTDSTRSPRSLLPSREAELSISINRLFENETTRVRGFATVEKAPLHLSDLVGAHLYFSLYRTKELSSSTPLSLSSTLKASGLVSPISNRAIDRSGFEDYLKASGVSFQLSRGVVLESKQSNGGWGNRFHAIQNWAHSALTRGIDSESDASRSYVAMMLGKKSELNEDRKSLFLNSGALHLFAISGLHIGIIAACGHATLLILRFPRNWIPLPNLILILVFVLMTGGAPSAWRALLMIACYYLCVASKRQSASLNALALSALVCLLINPQQLFLAGFQMSYATVSAILLYGVPLSDTLNQRWALFPRLPRKAWSWRHESIQKVCRFFIGSFAISLSAFIASSALSIAYFHTLPIAGILANILLLPLAFLTIVAGFLALGFATISAFPIVSLFNHAAQVTLAIMHGILEALSRLPRAFLSFDDPSSTAQLILLTLLLAFLLYAYDKQWRLPRLWLWTFPVFYPCACAILGAL